MELLDDDRHVGQVARYLERIVEGHDRLSRHRRPERGDAAVAPRAALEPVDAGPFADVVAVGGAAVEQLFLEARHDGALRAVALAVGVGRGEGDVQAGRLEQAFLDPDDDRQVEYGVVGRDANDGALRHGHHNPPRNECRGAPGVRVPRGRQRPW
jgi:hypothetical protein